MAEKRRNTVSCSKREVVKRKNKKQHKKFLKSGKARTVLISLLVMIALYIAGALGFVEVDSDKIDSILESVESISDQVTSIKEMLSDESEESTEDEMTSQETDIDLNTDEQQPQQNDGNSSEDGNTENSNNENN